MSGIVGIVNLDGSAVDCRLVHKLTDFLAFRGPDARRTYIKGNVGFGHALFKTTEECERDSQPLTLDGKTWIVADARIDARDELVAELKAAGQGGIAPSGWTDAELILRSYAAWKQNCLAHLLGDFAFGIWDETQQQLFCARDHMGVKPFYYAQFGSCVIFSNTLDCIRLHPTTSERLNDLAIGDFLLFGANQDRATTCFADIQRLPPAHGFVASKSGLQTNPYWSMPVDEPLFYKRGDDYLAHFRGLLSKAVTDRLRSSRVWIFMSGGLDSSTLAATARDLMQKRYADFDLRALTTMDSSAGNDGHYAQALASHLGIPIQFREPTYIPEKNWEQMRFSTPEPHITAWSVPTERQFWKGLGTYSRVFFFGEGPDNALHFDWQPYLSYLIRRNLYPRLFKAVALTLFSQRYPPFWLRMVRNTRTSETEAAFPSWLAPKFKSRLHLLERWAEFNSAPFRTHPFRPAGYASLQIPLWQTMFEGFDTATTQAYFEVRHPFLDLQLLRFMLAIPALPWCRSKYLIRRAMRDALPREVVSRTKTGAQSVMFKTQMADLCNMPFSPTAETREYIDPAQIQKQTGSQHFEGNLRVRSLNHWLQNSLRYNHNQHRDYL